MSSLSAVRTHNLAKKYFIVIWPGAVANYKYCEASDPQIFYKCPIFVFLTAFFRENENSDAEMIIFTNHESYLG